jgi:drug/metabolite transporter (DMT)-like permease
LTAWLALVAVYIFWGSTYLAIRVAVETLPPLLMGSSRFLIAGTVLYTLSLRGVAPEDRPTRDQWRAAAIIGGLLLLGGNGLVAIAEQSVPSGVTALLIATTPLWMAVLDRVPLRRTVLAGLVAGFAGVALLLRPSASEPIDLIGAVLVLGAALSWAVGSLYVRNAPIPPRLLLGTAMQMLAGGALMAVVGIAAGELGRLGPEAFRPEALLAVGWLVVAGSLVAYSAYTYVLRVLPTPVVATYAYVNPVIAVFLGWAILDEAVTGQTLLAAAVIVGAVALIVATRQTPRDRAADRPSFARTRRR